VTGTNLWTEFPLQFWKQQEDSAILLARNRPQQQWRDKETKTEREKKKQKERTNQERLWTSGLTRSSPLTRPKAKDVQEMSTDKYLKVDLLWLNSDCPFLLSRKKTHHIRLTPRFSLLPFSIFNSLILEITYQSWTFSLESQFLTTPKHWWESPLGFQQLQQTMKLNSSRDWRKSLSCTYCRWCALQNHILWTKGKKEGLLPKKKRQRNWDIVPSLCSW